MRRFIECLIPLTACNLRCSYCYVIQEGRRKNEKALFQYSPETIGKALSLSRLGGISLISITASGETFITPELPFIAKEILKQGHFINITTNGTLHKQISIFLEMTKGYHEHIHISFSFHFLELKRKNLIEAFFSNIKMVRDSGCSILLQINLCDEYIPYWDEIKKLSIRHVGALPQVALTRKESSDGYSIFTKLSDSEYIRIGREMASPLFEYTVKNFNIKRKEYCYAGFWSAKLNLATGIMTGCYGNGLKQNIFEDITRPIKWMPIGKHCCFKYCFNSSHFMSQGIIPELEPQPRYGELRNREKAKWYTKEMKDFLYSSFEDSNPLLTNRQKHKFNYLFYINLIWQKVNNRFNKYFHAPKSTSLF